MSAQAVTKGADDQSPLKDEQSCIWNPLTFSSAADMLSKRRMTFLPGTSKPCKSSDMLEVLEDVFCCAWPPLSLSGFSSSVTTLDVNVLSLLSVASDGSSDLSIYWRIYLTLLPVRNARLAIAGLT